MSILRNLGGLGGLSGLSGQGFTEGFASMARRQSHELSMMMQQQAQGASCSNPFSHAKRELSIKDELQKQTDEWLKDIKI